MHLPSGCHNNYWLMYVLICCVGVAQTAEASFNDLSCNALVCPDTPLFFTCTVTGSMASLATIRLPSGQVVNIHSDSTTSLGGGGLPEGVTIQSHAAEIDGLANYSLTLAIERASILTGSAIICEDGAFSPETDQAMCPVATGIAIIIGINAVHFC